MNERIKELILEATSPSHRSQGFGGEPTHIYPGKLDPEKFAELIVKECAIIANRADNTETEIRCMYDVITEHFGVE